MQDTNSPISKPCRQCGKVAPHLWTKSTQRYFPVCRDCHNANNRKYRQNHKHVERAYRKNYRQKHARINKEYLIKLLGGKCSRCGLEDSCLAVYDFHHRDPNEKEIGIARFIARHRSLDKIKKEISKCDLVCANCHRRIHHP